ncbi:AMP-binding protein [Mycolicibacterium vanbaalenii]|uniref:AMP-binding protein n=1 Tax=Mycolicibacterium vanbaalenii TaxID=110539 RepID=UPI00190F8D4B|nr:AMP-binding protein [Mycolicibacterium vanbaalenii]
MTHDFWYEPLTPLGFLDRAAAVHRDGVAVIDGPVQLTYGQLLQRCQRLAGALREDSAVGPVAVLAPNTHVMLEAHYGVPGSGSALLTLNIRLSEQELAWIVDHAEASTLIYDSEWAEKARAIAALSNRPLALVCAGGPDDEYESMLSSADEFFEPVADENGVISLNYTSGTTGKPKGVLYRHRGAYLQSLAMVAHTGLNADSAMLWTLPMFHCNGWCFTWAVTAATGTHVCLRSVVAEDIWRLIDEADITHLNGAPTVLAMMAYAKEARPLSAGRKLLVGTGGAPPTPAILRRMSDLGIDILHLYGLTETYGPVVFSEWRNKWSHLDVGQTAALRARQGIANVVSRPVRIVDSTGADVPADGATMGEVAVRGNNVMGGYLKDPAATAEAAPDGWFRTGDLGVMHPDGYLELRDRSKDVIISGGENISSIEIENVIASHPSVLEVAVIAVPDDKWGEVPGAYVTLHDGALASASDIVTHVRQSLAGFKVPKRVTFGPLPKTATGKVKKYALRSGCEEGRLADHTSAAGSNSAS